MVFLLTEGLTEVIVYQNPADPTKKNRGFAFLEYDSHKNASSAKRKLGSGRCRVWGCDLIIDWADPQDDPSDDVMATVCITMGFFYITLMFACIRYVIISGI